MRTMDEIKVGNPKSPLIKFSWLFLFTIFVILAGLVIHEYNHVWAGAIQGDMSGKIYFDFEYFYGIPVPVTGHASMPTNSFTLIAGGLFTGLMFLVVAYWARITKSLHDYYVEFSFMLVGACHLVYSVWEVNMLHKIPFSEYSLGSNIIYILVSALVIFAYRKELKMYLYES